MTVNDQRRLYEKAQERYENAIASKERPHVIIALWTLAKAAEKALVRAERAAK